MKQISLSKDFSVSPIIHGQCAALHKSDRGVALLFGTHGKWQFELSA